MEGEAVCEIGSIPFSNSTPIISAIANFQQSYGDFHPYLAAVLCIAGTLMNMVTVTVFTRPSMRSPVNILLCAVAICDIIVMTSYFIFVCHFLLAAANRCQAEDYSYSWAIFTMFHAHASVIFHATSIWLTVSLAQIRVMTIRRATSGPTRSISEQFTAMLSIVTCIIMSLVNLPNFMTFEIVEVPANLFLSCLRPIKNHSNLDIESISDDYDILMDGPTIFTVRASAHDCVKLKLAFWSNGMIFKVVPCIMLTVSIVALVKLIADVSHKRKALAQIMKKRVPKDHTTPMLVAVLSIFLLTELPQGVMLVLTGVFSQDTFHQKIYLPLGDLMDILSLLNSAVNFLIYCAMSRKFRTVFFQLFCSFLQPSILKEYDEEKQYNYERTDNISTQRISRLTTGMTKTEQLSHCPSMASSVTNGTRRQSGNNLLSIDTNGQCRQSKNLNVDAFFQNNIRTLSGYALNRKSLVPSENSENGDIYLIVPEGKQQKRRISFSLHNSQSRRESDASVTDFLAQASDKPYVSAALKGGKRMTLGQVMPLANLKKLMMNESMLLTDNTSSPLRRMNTLKAETGCVY